MQKITIKSIDIENFYGYAKAHYDFTPDKNVLCGATGSGKSTIINAILFALGYQKDGYQPQIDGQKVKGLKTTVAMVVTANGYEYELKTEVEQGWKTAKETGEQSYQGQKSMVCTFDGTVCKKNVYTDKVANLFGVSYDDLLMLLDMKTFNTNNPPKWTWVQRRKLLFKLLNIDEKIKELNNDSEFNLLADDLNKGKDEIDIQKMLNTEKKGISDEVAATDIRIGDRTTQLNELINIDFDSLRAEATKVWDEIQALNIVQTHKIEQEKIAGYLSQITTIEKEIAATTAQAHNATSQFTIQQHNLIAQIGRAKNQIESLSATLEHLRSQLEEVDNELDWVENNEYDEKNNVCAFCGQPLPIGKITELKGKFASEKATKIASLKAKQEDLATRIQAITKQIDTLHEDTVAKDAELQSLTAPTPADITPLQTQIEELKAKIAEVQASVTTADTDARKAELKTRYDELTKELTKETRLQELRQDITNFKEYKHTLGVREALRLRKQAQLNNYIQAKVKLVDRTVNEHFDGIKFLMNKRNSDKADNPFEMTCEAMYNGTPYSNQSNGEKIYSDICVAIGLRKLFDTNIPLLVDEKQSMTKDYTFDGQIVEFNTVKGENLNAVRIKDIYTLADCI